MLKWFASALLVAHVLHAVPAPTTNTTSPPPGLDLEQFFAALPKDRIEAIVTKHLTSDPGFVAAVRYLRGPEWAELKQRMRDAPSWMALKARLRELHLLDVDVLIGHLDHCLLDANSTELQTALAKDTGAAKANASAFMDDMKEQLAVPLMKAANGMMGGGGGGGADEGAGGGVKQYLEKLGQPEIKRLLEEALAAADVKAVLVKLKELGVQVDEALQFVYLLLNWEAPKKIEA